jgi:hypothetical protein
LTQAGANPGAVLNEVAAVTRRIIDGLLGETIVPTSVIKAFENKAGIDQAPFGLLAVLAGFNLEVTSKLERSVLICA